MQSPGTCRGEISANGIVLDVDTVNRELNAFVGGTPMSFDVPTGCVVVLRGERVKLRLVQPGDRVRVTFTETRGSRVARTVEVQTGCLHSP